MSTKKIILIIVGCICGWIVLSVMVMAVSFGCGLKLKKAMPDMMEGVKGRVFAGIPPEELPSQEKYKHILADEMTLFNRQGFPNFNRLREGVRAYWAKHKALPAAPTWVKEASINFSGGTWNATYDTCTDTDFTYQNLCHSDACYIVMQRNNKQGAAYELAYMVRPAEGKTLDSCEPQNKLGWSVCRALANKKRWEQFSTGFGVFTPLQ